MNYLRPIMILMFILLMPSFIEGQPFSKPRKSESEGKEIKTPRDPKKAIKEQQARERRLKKDYALFIKKSKKRSYAIQSPDVQARMKQNQKNTRDYYKSKNKKQSAGSKKAMKKYN